MAESQEPVPSLQTSNETNSEVVEKLSEIEYVPYESELQLPEIMRLMKADLSEPYSVYTYRYFIHNWPKLCLMVCPLWSVYLQSLYVFRQDVTINMWEQLFVNLTFTGTTLGEDI